jgi:hypothetical protein
MASPSILAAEMAAAETVASAMASATNTICLVKNTISLIHTVLKLGADTTSNGNIPALMAHNEYMMQLTIGTMQDSLELAKRQVAAGAGTKAAAAAAAIANHPEIQILENTLMYMRSSNTF